MRALLWKARRMELWRILRLTAGSLPELNRDETIFLNTLWQEQKKKSLSCEADKATAAHAGCHTKPSE